MAFNMNNLIKGNTTYSRFTFAGSISDENSDTVCAWVPIPGGSTITSIGYNNLIVYDANLNPDQAMQTSLHGYLVGVPQPFHGYSLSASGFNTFWDDYIPKDQDIDNSLNDYVDDSYADDNVMTTSADAHAVDSGIFADGGGEVNLGNILDSRTGPECFFARTKRLDITNGLIIQENKFRPVDKATGLINKNYHLSDDRYWWLMMANGAPKFEQTTDHAWQPNNDRMWSVLKYPEIFALDALMYVGEDHHHDATSMLMQHLEAGYIESGTYEDIGNVSGVSNAKIYNNITVAYRRPTYPGLRLNSKENVG